MAGRAAALRITDLPESVLFRIFELAGKEEGHSICLVCKSWNSLFFQAPGLWRSLLLDGRLAAARGKLAAWLAAKLSLLARLGSVVTVAHAELVDPEEDFFIERYPLDNRMSEDEGEDEGAQPSDSQPSGDAWDGVAFRHPGSLVADEDDADVIGHLPPEASAAIAGLTALRDLACNASLLDPELVTAAAGLQHLTALSLGGLPEGAPLGQLVALSKLRKLRLSMAESATETLELPEPAAFPALASFQVNRRGSEGLFQVAGAGVSKCSWGSVVKVEGLTGLRSWAHLLSALCPPAGNAMLHSLHVLHILDSELPAEAMQGCPPLPALFELHLHNCTDGPVGAAAPDGPGALSAPLSTAAAGALLRSAPLLCSLSLRGSFRGQLPEELASLHGLITLDLSRNGLTDLPPWPWLADLCTLSLEGNAFTRLPAVLSGATDLTRLELHDNWQMPLNTAAAKVLAQLDELQYLSFDGDLASKGFRKRLVPLLPDEREVHS